MARVTRAPFSKNSAERASSSRSPPEGPRRPSRTNVTLPVSPGALARSPGVVMLPPAVDERPTFMQASKAGEAIRAKLHAKGPAPVNLSLTVADAAAQTGLALRDAESGLKWLSTEYRGQLRVTAGGELVHVFPSGFTKPWAGPETRRRMARAVGRAFMGG